MQGFSAATEGSDATAECRASDITLAEFRTLTSGGGWYFQSVAEATDTDRACFTILNALHEEAGLPGVFSDWPATVTSHAKSKGL